MENTIDSKNINNRKIILEVRFKSSPLIVDKRGEILQSLMKLKMFAQTHWELGNGEVKIFDTEEPEKAKSIIYVDIKKFTVVSSFNHTNDSFYNMFDKTYKAVKAITGEVEIERIGCRIIGTYKADSSEYSKILNGFKKSFPSQVLLEDFPVNDLRLQLVYQNGQYNIGPIKKDDPFFKKEFPNSDAQNAVGFGIDTDNYILKPDSSTIKDSSIKDVFMTSLSVEKLLFEKLRSF